MEIDKNGAMLLLGVFYPSSTGLSSSNQDFVITSSGSPIVQLIQSSGDLKITGTLTDKGGCSSLSSSGNFVIENSDGNSVAWFTGDGNLCLDYCLLG